MRDVSGSARGPRFVVLVYVGGVAICAAGFGLWLASYWGTPKILVVAFFWLLHIAAESSAIQLPAGSLSAGFLILMAAAFCTSPPTAAAVGFLSALSLLELRTSRSTVRIVFNAAQGAIYTGAAAIVFWVVRAGDVGPLAAVTATLLSASTAFVLNTGLVAGVLSVERGRNVLRAWRELLWPAPNYLGFAFAALMVSSLYRSSGPLAATFLLTPLLVLRVAHKGYVELEKAQTRTLHAFVRAVELKDPYTKGHSERVAEIAVALFRELGVDETELRELYYGALLHDLGKVAVSGRILAKPGPLSRAEYEVIKRHPSLGAAIAREIGFLANQVPQILFHHERLDGSGYPWGLKGEAIPFEARVLAVADAFDALTWHRPYREALTDVDAMEEIRHSVGTQLDPVPVAALDGLLARGHQFSRRLAVDRKLDEIEEEPFEAPAVGA